MSGMLQSYRRILIIDEAGFCRVCSALLEAEGYRAEAVSDLGLALTLCKTGPFGLIITSYPFGAGIFKEIKGLKTPMIVLSDQVSRELIGTLQLLDSSYCMIKPIDYMKFRGVVRRVLSGAECGNGCKII